MVDVSESSSFDLVLFVVCAYAYTWISGVLLWVLGVPLDIFTLVAMAGPFIGAVVVVVRRSGVAGLREFLVRAFRWRFNPLWYVVALLIPLVIFAAKSWAAIGLLGAAPPAVWFSPDFPIGFMVGFLIWNAIGEELGWRGFALPKLQQRFGSLLGGVFLGVIWAFWHLPLFFIPGSYQYGESLVEYVVLLVSWTIVMTMLYNKAQCSVLPAMILHEAQNFTAFALNSPGGSGIFALLFWVLAAVLSVALLPRPFIKVEEMGEPAPTVDALDEPICPVCKKPCGLGYEQCPHCGVKIRRIQEPKEAHTAQ